MNDEEALMLILNKLDSINGHIDSINDSINGHIDSINDKMNMIDGHIDSINCTLDSIETELEKINSLLEDRMIPGLKEIIDMKVD